MLSGLKQYPNVRGMHSSRIAPEASTPAELGQVIAQTLDDVAATIREFGMQQE